MISVVMRTTIIYKSVRNARCTVLYQTKMYIHIVVSHHNMFIRAARPSICPCPDNMCDFHFPSAPQPSITITSSLTRPFRSHRHWAHAADIIHFFKIFSFIWMYNLICCFVYFFRTMPEAYYSQANLPDAYLYRSG